ncbi:tetratricopeptide repeat protein [Paraglaciecola sp. MB-3u-78]|uniref:tetratricopeptide repeat protein n=1 Tax=Paraglaciecola sp. MB-3u-78 TaxID=2058332 RepID=UPI000C32DA23|nr:tetratricopeptide repeat protein [Paraglaciecola sp. MB-3u-78]PKG96915.1 hypothetical protein CXF95_22730 [Paraglaciecola sp. MB-3u-78]
MDDTNKTNRPKSLITHFVKCLSVAGIFISVTSGCTDDSQLFADACYSLSVERDFESALPLCKRAADEGYGKAQYELGMMYIGVQGVSKDDKQAEYWLTKAAEQGVANAQLALGGMFFSGQDIPKDDKQSIYWFTKAAEQGDMTGQYYLGSMYSKGIGSPKDDKQAIFWLTKAAEQGHEDAQISLNTMSESDVGPRKMSKQDLSDACGSKFAEEDYRAAFPLCKQAAELGVLTAQMSLVLMYNEGKGTPRDGDKMYYWLKKAERSLNEID